MVKANAFADEFNECIKNDFMIPRRTGISYSTDYRLRSGKLHAGFAWLRGEVINIWYYYTCIRGVRNR